jgi:hypothetical protein
MAFEDIAKRMSDRRKPTRAEKLREIWTGEPAAPPPLPLPPVPVPAAQRRGHLVGAWAVMMLGLAVAMCGAFLLIVLFDSTSTGEKRGLVGVIAVGIAIIVKSTKMFDRHGLSEPSR